MEINRKDLFPEGVEKIFRDHRQKRNRETFQKDKYRIVRYGMLAASLFLIMLYFLSPVSNVRSISVSGNHYLKDSYIIGYTGLNARSKFYFCIPGLVENKIKSDPLIEDAKVTLQPGNVINIDVKEKKAVGYRYEDQPVILFADNTKAELKSEYLDIVASIPLINGFTEEEQTRLLTKAFEDIDENIIHEMSEISQYPLSYDPDTITVLMRDGGYFIGNYFNLSLINQYYEIYSYQKNKNYCIYAADNRKNAFAKACPWDEEDAVLEYWTDEKGDPIVNKYGDLSAKHYYKDAEGNYAEDVNGNRIVIPIDEDGLDVYDDRFQEHYEAGFYDTGELVIPEGYDDSVSENEETYSEETDTGEYSEEESVQTEE